jgi:group I intron endonuclease
MFVYVIVNDVNQKIYVGKTVTSNLEQYLQKKFWYAKMRPEHRSHLYAAIRKYGREHFHIHPLISDCKTNEELSHWEQTLIKAFASQNPEIGYNICRGGEGFTGSHSPATRQKIADASREMWQRPGIKENFTAKMTGHAVSQKTVDAVRRMRLGAKATPETIEKLRNSHIGLASSRRKSVRCLDTDEVFPSLAAVVKRFGDCTTNLSRAIKKGYSFQGKRFEYAQQP